MTNPFLALAGLNESEALAPVATRALSAPLDSVVDRIAKVEGTGQNPRSSARGVGQFTDDTLIGTYRRHYPQSGLSKAEILALKGDPNAMRSMTGLLVKDNANALQATGHEPTPGNIYLAHYFGPQGAQAMLSADPRTPVANIVGREVMAANPNLAGMSAGDVIKMTAGKMGGAQAPGAPALAPSPSGEAAPLVPAGEPQRTNRFMALASAHPTGAPDQGFAGPADQQGAETPGLFQDAAQWTAASDPIANAILNGGDHKLATYARGVQDSSTGFLHGALQIPETALHGAAWVTDKLGGHKSADLMRTAADQMDALPAKWANDPNSPAFDAHTLIGNVVATAPVSEVRALEAIPALAKATRATALAKAAGESTPLATKVAAGLAHYGDMALQGGAAGALASGGKDTLENAIGGAVFGPAAGAVVEKVAAPVLSAVGGKARDLATKVIDRLSANDAQAGRAALDDAAPAVSQAIRKASDIPEGWSPDEAAQGWRRGADGKTEFAPDAARLDNGVKIEVARPGERFPDDQPSGAAQAALMDRQGVASAMGSQGARNGIEATTDLPAKAAQHVGKLLDEGVPLEHALREADIAHVGGKPTIAAVTRDAAHQQAQNEGAKMLQTAEGRALNAQVAANNNAVHAKMQGLVDQHGGIPAQGEAAETAATSLAKAADIDRAHVQRLYQDAAKIDGEKTVRPDLLREVLHDPMNQATVSDAGSSFVAGMQKRLDLLTDNGRVGLTPDALEVLRKSANAAYQPVNGGEVNELTRKVKAAIDEGLDQLGDAGPAYAKARAASRAYKKAYENPQGVADLIARDNEGRFLNADNWRKAENGLIGTMSDSNFAQVVSQLRANGDTQALARLKAGILQKAYQAASKGAADSGGNSVANGARYFDALNNSVGMPKLKAIFSPDELADIAATGRAAIHLNSPVPGTANHSNSASAILSNDMAKRMMVGIHGPKSHGSGLGLIAGSSIAGGAATFIGHTLVGPAAAVGVPVVKLTANAIAKRAANRALSSALHDAANPAAARSAAAARNARIAEALRKRPAVNQASRTTQRAAATSKRGHAVAEALRRVATPASDRAQ